MSANHQDDLDGTWKEYCFQYRELLYLLRRMIERLNRLGILLRFGDMLRDLFFERLNRLGILFRFGDMLRDLLRRMIERLNRLGILLRFGDML
jgi:hypothetical protein